MLETKGCGEPRLNDNEGGFIYVMGAKGLDGVGIEGDHRGEECGGIERDQFGGTARLEGIQLVRHYYGCEPATDESGNQLLSRNESSTTY